MEQEKEKLKGVDYYRKILHYDTLVLLIVSVVFAIAGICFISKYNSENFVPILLKSILFIVFEVFVLINKKETNQTVGILSVINGVLMIITSIGDNSLFGIVYLLLGIFYIIHSVIYLNKLNNTNNINEVTDNNKENTKLKYLTLIPNVLALLFVFGILEYEMIISIIILAIVIIVNIINIIFCVFLNKKYNKSILVYITMIISILAILINGVVLIDDVGSKYVKNKNTAVKNI